MIFLYGKGATAYELQIGPLVFSYVHLQGGYFTRWRFWRRVSVRYYPEDWRNTP